ncbi:MAG TPA: GH3 auxin-responsive promoter family protein [Flavobacteriales bacterium]
MGVKSFFSKILAGIIAKRVKQDAVKGIELQHKVMMDLVRKARDTAFGRDHSFASIRSYEDFKKHVPIRDYEEIAPYLERVKNGERDVLWPGLPTYFCKTSGTTSGTKYIPLTKDSIPNHINSARNALLCYIAETGRAEFVDGKMIFLQGSPELEKLPSGIPFGRLSGIVANHVPAYLQKNRMPSYATNCIEDWETKVNTIADETLKEDMTLISGIPNWVQMYFEILLKKTGKKTISEIFPNYSLFVFGGVNFEPYRKKFEELIGKKIPTIETYPASEGFIAYQDSQKEEGLLLNVNSGIFFEFIPTDEYFNENPTRLSLAEVKTDVNYAIIINNNAGLWGYSIGDTVKFVSVHPPRIKVTGRIKHYTSAFGEHVIAEEVERAMSEACTQLGITVTEFHVAPQVSPVEGLPYHEWFVETDDSNIDLARMRSIIDTTMQSLNVYYKDLITGNVLQPTVITLVKKGAFNEYMKSVGRLGGQNKVPRLANDRKIADVLIQHKV